MILRSALMNRPSISSRFTLWATIEGKIISRALLLRFPLPLAFSYLLLPPSDLPAPLPYRLLVPPAPPAPRSASSRRQQKCRSIELRKPRRQFAAPAYLPPPASCLQLGQIFGGKELL